METTRHLIENSRGSAVRLQDIAQASGVSRQAIYLHFGSRVGLMVATVQYVDKAGGLREQIQHICDKEDSAVALAMFVEFWAGYVPTIYGIAKQLLVLREADEGAAAAWQDRMDSLRNGPCRYLIEHLEKDDRLNPEWQTEAAIDFLWMVLSIQTWASLVIDRGWSSKQYTTKLNQMLQHTLIATA